MYDNNHDNNGTYLTIQDVNKDDVQYKHILQNLVNLDFIVNVWVFFRFKIACECVEIKSLIEQHCFNSPRVFVMQ